MSIDRVPAVEGFVAGLRGSGQYSDLWRGGYLSHVARVLAPDHWPHGFRAEPVFYGSDAQEWSSYTKEGASIGVSVEGMCPCGQQVRGQTVANPDDFAKFMRDLTGPAA